MKVKIVDGRGDVSGGVPSEPRDLFLALLAPNSAYRRSISLFTITMHSEVHVNAVIRLRSCASLGCRILRPEEWFSKWHRWDTLHQLQERCSHSKNQAYLALPPSSSLHSTSHAIMYPSNYLSSSSHQKPLPARFHGCSRARLRKPSYIN